MTEYSIIVASTVDGGIGKNNTIPWYIKEDLQYFKDITTDYNSMVKLNAVIMGRNTWESLPRKPLKYRLNIVVSTTLEQEKVNGALIVRSLYDAHIRLRNFTYINQVFVIGGTRLYNEAILDNRYTKIYITKIYDDYDCDTFIDLDLISNTFKNIIKGDEILISESNNRYSHAIYEKIVASTPLETA